jgi:hypothetical protein
VRGDASLVVQILSLPLLSLSLSLTQERCRLVAQSIATAPGCMNHRSAAAARGGEARDEEAGEHERAAHHLLEAAVGAEAPTVEDGVLLDRALAGPSKRRPEYPRQRRPVMAVGALGAR